MLTSGIICGSLLLFNNSLFCCIYSTIVGEFLFISIMILFRLKGLLFYTKTVFSYRMKYLFFFMLYSCYISYTTFIVLVINTSIEFGASTKKCSFSLNISNLSMCVCAHFEYYSMFTC